MLNYSKRLISLCIKLDLTISVAESCTGGLISSNLVAIPGASKVFNSFPDGSSIGGAPAQDMNDWKKLVASQRLNIKKRKKK